VPNSNKFRAPEVTFVAPNRNFPLQKIACQHE